LIVFICKLETNTSIPAASKVNTSQEWWCRPVIPILESIEAGGSIMSSRTACQEPVKKRERETGGREGGLIQKIWRTDLKVIRESGVNYHLIKGDVLVTFLAAVVGSVSHPPWDEPCTLRTSYMVS
jgi:hypothetical protein